jgi:hypothetical protein
MANTIKIKRSAVPGKSPTVSDLELGELAINTHDGRMYFKRDPGTGEMVIAMGSAEVSNVLYVAKSGNDTNNNGKSLIQPFLTIKAALAAATSGTTVFVKSGDYTEDNPITIPAGVAVVGDSLRTVTVRPANTSSHIFYVNNGSYATGMTFRGHINGASAFAFNPDSSAGTITTSPYIQNCSSITTTGKGIFIDGSKVGGVKSMVLDSYTQFNQGGMGVHITNGGYAQLVSIFTICCDVGILCENGASCSITNSNTSFGTYGLKASGTSSVLYTGATNGIDQTGNTIVIDGLSTRPKVNDVVSFDSGVTFYTIDSATELSSGSSTVTLLEEVTAPLADNTTANFYQRSLISASGHTFEYVGSGNSLFTALPQAGGIPIQENEVVEDTGGKVFFTSTDQKGDFRIGGDLLISRSDGTITGTTFDKSLFAVLTPYILAIEG